MAARANSTLIEVICGSMVTVNGIRCDLACRQSRQSRPARRMPKFLKVLSIGMDTLLAEETSKPHS
jgi:hypothetical protein